MSEGIERALANAHGKLDNQNSRQCRDDFDRERRQILTDLAAESRKGEELLKLEYLRYWDAERVAREKAEARLAAVEERCEQATCNEFAAEILALVRGAGGEQVGGTGAGEMSSTPPSDGADTPAAPDATLAAVMEAVRNAEHWMRKDYPTEAYHCIQDALARGEEAAEVHEKREGGEQVQVGASPAQSLTGPETVEPATPDVPQITMHALDLDHLRGECRECGREPEHPCHGGSWGYDPTRGR